MSIESNESLQVPVSSEVFDYLKNLLDLKCSDESIDVALKRALHFFATGEYGANVADVIHSLVAVAPHFIKFPPEEELLEVQRKFYYLSRSGNAEFGFPNVIGVIDCVHVNFRPMEEHNVEVYRNHNSEYSINAQLVCGPDLQVYNVLAAFPGKFENLEIWRNSKLCQQLSQCDNNTQWLIGDAKYYREPNIMTPIVNPETEPDLLYNDAHSSVYKYIKYCSSMLQTRFRCLKSVLNFNPDTVCAVTIACCVLHNICICYNDLIEIDTSEIDLSFQSKKIEPSGESVEAMGDTKSCYDANNK